MTERERLIEILKEDPCDKLMSEEGGCHGCPYEHLGMAGCFEERFADHLLANGVIVPPVKIGQPVYPLHADPRFRAFVERIEQTTNGLYFDWVQYDVGVDCTECWDEERFDVDDIGKTVFIDETEYLKALKERSEGK